MKKIYTFIIMALFVFILIGCTTNETPPDITPEPDPEEEKILNDKIAPILSFTDSSKKNVTVKQNSDYDMFEGLHAIDNLEGDITIKIEVDLGDFNIEKPGFYELVFFVSDRAGNVSNLLIKEVTVIQVYQLIERYPIYTDVIADEKPAPGPLPVFQGAYYHRVSTAKDKWVGIEAEFTLPMPDINRYQTSYNDSLNMDPNSRNLDNPSIYMGGQASHESDVGLSLKTVLVKSSGGSMAVSVGSYAFRPFWRYISSYDYDIGGYDRANGRYYAVSSASAQSTKTKNMIGNWDFMDTQYYYLPGDRLRMVLYAPKPGYLQLQIEVIEKSTLQYSIDVRAYNEWKDPENFISPVFASPGHGGTVDALFKRVNAIDQVANEGKPVHPTTSLVNEMVWHNVYLHRNINGTMYRVVMNESRTTSMSAPQASYFTTSAIDHVTGGQTVKIHPNNI
ncbi:DUF5011 domain-containing protein [Acholeplasma laidlawii]|uniref:DUF5011 domain-containing protein n=1 Tax=Acholeplasma laidlawii TaxID=2148 RepID=UPI0021F7E6F4|nr:DUF5011 domain-containing protein [Acholeplasma laidlawii]